MFLETQLFSLILIFPPNFLDPGFTLYKCFCVVEKCKCFLARMKEQLIRELVKTGKDAEQMNKQYADKIAALEKVCNNPFHTEFQPLRIQIHVLMHPGLYCLLWNEKKFFKSLFSRYPYSTVLFVCFFADLSKNGTRFSNE